MGTDAVSEQRNKTEPKLRHEFVGMMFALAIGEVGVQISALVRAHHWVHFLPAYSHLFLATIVIAASWVGWTLSPAPGARQDVHGVLQWEFLVLLIDVFLVIVYFILVKTVDITGEDTIRLNASARPETKWILVMFAVYLIWDLVTKIAVFLKMETGQRSLKEWFDKYGIRIVPTAACLSVIIASKPLLDRADPPHVLTADLALVSLVLLFRALKALADFFTLRKLPTKWPLIWAALCLFGLGIGLEWTRSWPVFECVASQIRMEPNEQMISPDR